MIYPTYVEEYGPGEYANRRGRNYTNAFAPRDVGGARGDGVEALCSDIVNERRPEQTGPRIRRGVTSYF
jgi:hypothetical protein